MAKYRGSIYFDIEAESEEKAREIANRLVNHLDAPESIEAPTEYYNAYTGGVALWISGDLFGNLERCKDI